MATKFSCLFHSIGHRILFLFGSLVVLALLWMMLFYARQQEEAILSQNERTMVVLTDGLSRGLQTMMLGGYADIAQNYAKALKAMPGIMDFRILRLNGQEAFLDNTTIEAVNNRIGEEEFLPRESETTIQILPKDDPNLLQLVQKQERVTVYNGNEGESLLTFLVPIENQKPCRRCHGSDTPLRGILKITTSLDKAHEDIAHSRQSAVRMGGISLLIILLVTFGIIRHFLVRPVLRVTQAMANISGGNLHQQVPVIGCDELTAMAESFNSMSGELAATLEGLQSERDKLNTIILSAQEGIAVTNRQGDVVLVNPALERLLGKSAEAITQGGFLNLIDDPTYLSAYLEREGQGMPEIVVYNERVLTVNAATIRDNSGQVTGSAALIRDVTEEKKLEKQLRKLSTTDALTGLFNRRRFDEVLAEELLRAKRYGQEFTLLFFDVDFFKKFNDTHGHDQGDRVLQAIGQQMYIVMREIDHPCRYGGEEFCAVLPNTGLPGGQLAAERLRQQIEAMVVDGLKVTISIGVACFPHTGLYPTPDSILKAADDALYESKKGGRNRVTIAQHLETAKKG